VAAVVGHAGAFFLTGGWGRLALDVGGAAGAPPDVLLCDIAMPEEDGYLTLRKIRAWETASGAARIPAIALTAFALREDRVRALASGYKMHLTKPVAPAELIAVIATVAKVETAAAPA
jgi:CheY-like chemotaxis protein